MSTTPFSCWGYDIVRGAMLFTGFAIQLLLPRRAALRGVGENPLCGPVPARVDHQNRNRGELPRALGRGFLLH
ncbi:MAG: hypothetical protein WBH15_04490, partial [Candidatus Methanoculleus thermohydrogenotrophicum]